jgi:hypothetical protein
MPMSNNLWQGSYAYYLSRVDKVGLFADGTFKIIEGVDAV